MRNELDESSEDLRAAYLDIQKAQTRLDADREAIRKKILAAEPSWGPCLQCGHTWRSHNIRRRLGKPPRRCPKCLSSYWFDPDYMPRERSKVPDAEAKSVGIEGQGGPQQRTASAPEEMPPPPKFEFAPPESVRFAEDGNGALEMMKKARKDDDSNG